MKVLIADRQSHLADLVALHLRSAGVEVAHCADGAVLQLRVEHEQFDLVVLGQDLPAPDGFALCAPLRQRHPLLPILMLCEEDNVADLIRALEAGADDCMAKPCNVLELIARIRALLRRRAAQVPPAQPSRPIVFDQLSIDVERRAVKLTDRPVKLTEKEFDLLLFLSRAPGRVYSREQLLQSLWGDYYQGYEHTVNSHINRLRAKIEPSPAHPQFIQTVWGVGYRFCALAPGGQGGY